MTQSQVAVIIGRFVPPQKRRLWIATVGMRRVLKTAAFLPYSKKDSGNPEEVSTYQVQEKSIDEVVQLSVKVEVPQPIEGYGELLASFVESQVVCLVYDNVPQDHVGIRCWESLGQEQRLAVATILADAARFVSNVE